MRHVIVYDISPDDVRLAVSRVLEGVGVRVQESVFECDLETPDLPGLMDRLKGALAAPKHGQVRIYRVCRECYLASCGLGAIETGGAEPAIVVA